MASQLIAWGDGSGESFTLSYTAASGNQTVTVTSPINTSLSSRSKTIAIKTTTGSPVITKTVLITQLPNDYGLGTMVIGTTFVVR